MNRAQGFEAPAELSQQLLLRPLMAAEVLDTAFRLFRASLLRCLPYSGLAVLVLQMPMLYSTFGSRAITRSFDFEQLLVGGIALLLCVALFGVLTLRLHAVWIGARPRFRSEIWTVLRRWPAALIATFGAVGLPAFLYLLGAAINMQARGSILLLLFVLLIWPLALVVTALPAFWCEPLGPFAALAQATRVSWRRSGRIVGVLIATLGMLMVFYVLTVIILFVLAPILGRTDLVLVALVTSLLTLVAGAIGLPFVLAVLLVMYEDLKLRRAGQRRHAQ